MMSRSPTWKVIMSGSRSRKTGTPTTGGIQPTEREPLTGPQAAAVLRALVEDGWLIGVEIFGAHCCDDPTGCESETAGFGISDVFGPASVGSDCNRSESFLLRPADALMHKNLELAIHDEKSYQLERAQRGQSVR